MWEIPLKLIFINPAIDIAFLILVFYFFIRKIYARILKENIQKIFWIDLKLAIILLSLGYLNYSEMDIEIFSLKISWFIYILIIQFIVEIIFFGNKVRYINENNK